MRKALKYIVIALVVIGIIGAFLKKKEEDVPEDVSYTKCYVQDMTKALKENALSAKNTYDGAYIELTGRLGVIDSDGKYITLYSTTDKYALTGVQCYTKSDGQKSAIAKMKKDDVITIKVKIKSVGEVLGYSADIVEMN